MKNFLTFKTPEKIFFASLNWNPIFKHGILNALAYFNYENLFFFATSTARPQNLNLKSLISDVLMLRNCMLKMCNKKRL